MIKKICTIIALIVFFSNSSLAFEKNAENFILETTQNAKKIILDKAISDKR